MALATVLVRKAAAAVRPVQVSRTLSRRNGILNRTPHHLGAVRSVSSVVGSSWIPTTATQYASNVNASRLFSSSVEESDTEGEVPHTYMLTRRSGIRNVAIVAHVDHGKTTLVDELLKETSSNEGGAAPMERLMDSGELEMERGITITSKVTRLDFMGNTINVVDTPGHADFAGEVDRILSMVDGVVLVVDAAEGPMAQTKYVLSRALMGGLRPLVVLNKADRPDAASRIASSETESELLDLFDVLGATEDQMNYPTLYASARNGWVTKDEDVALQIAANEDTEDTKTGLQLGMKPLLHAILETIPEPLVHFYEQDGQGPDAARPVEAFLNDKFSMAATTVGYDPYLGRTCTGRIYSGSVKMGDSVLVLPRASLNQNADSTSPPPQQMTQTQAPPQTKVVMGLFVNRGVSRMAMGEGEVSVAGDIVTLAGVPDSIQVGDTVTGSANPVPLPIDTPPLAPPTLSMDFGANTSPLVGQEDANTIVTSSRIQARLVSETDNNVTLTVSKEGEKMIVFGRGELQLGILIEQMRREGYELTISPPRIVTKICPDTREKLEPYEEVTVDVDAEHSGTVVNALTGARKGVLCDMINEASTHTESSGKTRLIFEVPSRGLLGFGPEIATATRGTAIVHHAYLEDRPYAGNLGLGLEKSKLVSNALGKSTLFALASIAERGTLFIEPGDAVYPGMVIGELTKVTAGDMEVNPVRAKAVNNMRTVNKEERLMLPPPKKMNVEELIGYMNDDEQIEVTPKSIRLRKAELDSGVRERAARTRKKQLKSLSEQQKGGKRK